MGDTGNSHQDNQVETRTHQNWLSLGAHKPPKHSLVWEFPGAFPLSLYIRMVYIFKSFHFSITLEAARIPGTVSKW